MVAEISANHNRKYEQAVRIVRAAKDAGADAVKLQTYTADTITMASEREEFRVSGGTLWDGRTLHDLYAEAFMPWDWQPDSRKWRKIWEWIVFPARLIRRRSIFWRRWMYPRTKLLHSNWWIFL